MNILVIGSGAREHALAWKLRQSPQVSQLFVAPGNAGTAAIATNLPLSTSDLPALASAAQEHKIDLAVVGPEAPLAAGIVDLFQEQGIPVFGPTQAATRIESSKVFAKELMLKYNIPCARGEVFDSYPEARAYLQKHPLPVVVKADGLAAGKGVTVANTKEEALEALSSAMERRAFGTAGDRVIIEECLIGREVSLLAFADGETVAPMVPACDYKRALDADQGPNTGGMGGYSPPRFFHKNLAMEVQERILVPAVRALAREGSPYRGVLYAGLMVTKDGPQVLEFNARFGDPETQVILPRLKTDLVEILVAVVEGKLHGVKIGWHEEACVGVVMASGGYPASYETGHPISGLDTVDEDTMVFHAGTKIDPSGQVVTDGGRVLTVAALGQTISQARKKVYANVPRIHFPRCHYRGDIAALEED
ncbi:MAG: phosphoribosylamine--glycine ligase [Chloroflexi bacterium]|nr:phosphoribosylamine--glycine ligase [Chloroflexota bacterium]